ncbi:MAG: RluA family pseudouridine synthase [Tepidisphaerales bacterium]
MPFELLFDDEHYVAVNKPAGLAAIPGRGETTCAIEALSLQLRLPCSGTKDPRLRVVHRIDKDTSGVLLLAKNIEAQRHASHQFQNNAIHKEYLAIVAGRPMEAEGEIDAPIGVHPANRRLMSIGKHGRPARTQWKLEQQFRTVSLLRVFPLTGKTHQIRVHLRSIGLPLAIDELYNPLPAGEAPGLMLSSFKRDYRQKPEGERPLIARLTLHAEKLTFAHLDGRTIEIVAPPPKDFRAALSQLRKHGC